MNIVVFAEADDFFLAGLRNPKIFLFTFPAFAFGIAFIFIRINRLAKEQQYIYREEREIQREIEKTRFDGDKERLEQLESKQKEMKQYYKERLSFQMRRASLMIFPILLLGIVSIFTALHFELKGHLNRVVNKPEMMATIKLRTGDSLPVSNENPIVFITATEKFMFFYQHDNNNDVNTIIVPIASVADVSFSKFKGAESPSNKSMQPTANAAAD